VATEAAGRPLRSSIWELFAMGLRLRGIIDQRIDSGVHGTDATLSDHTCHDCEMNNVIRRN